MSSAEPGPPRDTSCEARNMELMQTLDDAWNAQDMQVQVAYRPRKPC